MVRRLKTRLIKKKTKNKTQKWNRHDYRVKMAAQSALTERGPETTRNLTQQTCISSVPENPYSFCCQPDVSACQQIGIPLPYRQTTPMRST